MQHNDTMMQVLGTGKHSKELKYTRYGHVRNEIFGPLQCAICSVELPLSYHKRIERMTWHTPSPGRMKTVLETWKALVVTEKQRQLAPWNTGHRPTHPPWPIHTWEDLPIVVWLKPSHLRERKRKRKRSASRGQEWSAGAAWSDAAAGATAWTFPPHRSEAQGVAARQSTYAPMWGWDTFGWYQGDQRGMGRWW